MDGENSISINEVDGGNFKGVNATKKTSDTEIELKDENSKKLKYKFENEKLFLYGVNEGHKPYVLHEIKTEFKTEYYLDLKGKYYQLNPRQIEKIELNLITNEELIIELNKK